MKKQKAIGYIRTVIPDPLNVEIRRQEERISACCESNGLFLVKIFIDNGTDRLHEEQQGWAKLKKFLTKHPKINFLLIADLSKVNQSIIKGIAELKFLKEKFGVLTLDVMGAGEVSKVDIKREKKRKGKRL